MSINNIEIQDDLGNSYYPKTKSTIVMMNDGSTLENKMANHGNHIPAPQTANNKVFLRNDNTWQTITPANIGAANASHGNHVPTTQSANARVFLRNDNTWQTLPSATTSATGIVQLNDATNSTSTTQAATANAVKKAYDLANGKAASNHTHSNYVLTSTGGSTTIHADSDASSASEYALIKAGHNELKVTSSAGGSTVTKGQDKLTFNGNVVYHAGKKPTATELGVVPTSDYTLYTISKNLQVTTSWMDTGIVGNNLPSGSYIVQVSGMTSDATNTWYEIWTGVMSWYNGTTNNTASDEILLHKTGHASNNVELYLRTIRSSGGGYVKLQIACSRAFTKATNVTFKFRKLI